jgi:hypothetical protein
MLARGALPHAQVCQELGDAHRELAQIESAVIAARRSAWENSEETTVTGRTMHMEFATGDLAMQAIQIKGEIRALEYELRAIEWEGKA